MTESKETEPRQIRAVENSLRIVDALYDLEKAGITKISEVVNLSKTTVYNHLNTLVDHGYVVKSGEAYKLSLYPMYLGKSTQQNHPLYIAGKSEIDDLAEETGQFAHLFVEQNGCGVYLYKNLGEQAVKDNVPVGHHDLLHHSAAGKAILSQLPRERVERIISEHGLPELTENTITDRQNLYEDIDKTTQKGYSLNLEEEVKGINAIGVPLRIEEKEMTAAISLSGTTGNMTKNKMTKELFETVQNAANAIEIKINKRWDSLRSQTRSHGISPGKISDRETGSK